MSMLAPDRSLLALVLDVTPSTWGERDLKRTANDKARIAAGRRSKGPAILEDALVALLTFLSAFASTHRDNCVVVVGVAADEVAVLYPRKAGPAFDMASAVMDSSDLGSKVDSATLHETVRLGVAELVARAAGKAERAAAKAAAAAKLAAASGEATADNNVTRPRPGAAIAAALSVALCCINRFMVACHAGVSAVASDSLLRRGEDDGVLGILGTTAERDAKDEESEEEKRRARGVPSSRILIVQVTEDRSVDYNAIMNCVFCALKHEIVLDGCFIPSGIPNQPKSSAFLEQAVDRTNGVFLAPSGAAQIEGALTEVMLSVFLPPLSARRFLNLPALPKVDYRARCFQTGESVDMAYVCNQCLSIFKNKPTEYCLTCGCLVRKIKDTTSEGAGATIATTSSANKRPRPS